MMERNPINPKELTAAIKKFKNSRVGSTTIDQFRSMFSKIDSEICFPIITCPIGGRFHRMRINTDGNLFNSLDDLWCPPKEFILRYGRLNNISEQILYTSGGGHTCLFELNPPPGSIVTCVEFEAIEPITSIEIGMHNRYRKDLFFDQYWKRFDLSLNQFYMGDRRMLSLDKKLKDFFSSEFTKKVSQGQEELYKRTIAIANSLLSSSAIECIIYPSVKSGLREVNFAIPERVARRVLKANRIDVLEILPGKPRPLKHLSGCYEGIDFNKKIVYTAARKLGEWAIYQPFYKTRENQKL